MSKVAPGAPEYISHVSDSLRGVVMRLCPGRRRSSSAWISSLLIGRRGGTPSTTQPTPLPCDSPNVDTRNSVPNVLPVACTTSRLALQGLCCALWTRHCRLWPLGSRALGPITCCARAWLATPMRKGVNLLLPAYFSLFVPMCATRTVELLPLLLRKLASQVQHCAKSLCRGHTPTHPEAPRSALGNACLGNSDNYRLYCLLYSV